MKKYLVLSLVIMFSGFLLGAPTQSGATIWNYSGITQSTLPGDPTVYNIYFSVNLSDRLWDRWNSTYVTPVPGTPISSAGRYQFLGYDWYIDVIGGGTDSGSSGLLGDGATNPDGSLVWFDDLILSKAPGNVYNLYTSYFQDYDGTPWDFWSVDSANYGQLAPVIGFGSGIQYFFPTASGPDSIWFDNTPFALYRNPTPVASEPVPEPATILLTATGIAGLVGATRRKYSRKKKA